MIMAAHTSFFRRKDLFSFYGEIYNCDSFYFLARVLDGKSHMSFAKRILDRCD